MIKYTPQQFALVIILLLFSLPVFAASSVEQAIYKDIKKAQQNLGATEKRIAAERRKLIRKLNGLENEVLALKKKTAVVRRLADEKTLSLSQLETRLNVWRQQQVYQQNLLNRFLRQHAQDAGTDGNLTEQLTVVVSIASKLGSRFYPIWTQRDVAMENGKLESLATLALGPVTWFWQEKGSRAGFASVAQSGLKAGTLLNEVDSKNIGELMANDDGIITFDPTLNKALMLEQYSETVLEHIIKGGLWVIPILLFAVFALSIASIKSVQLMRLPKIVRFSSKHIQELLGNSESVLLLKVKGRQKELLDICRIQQSSRLRDDQLFIYLQKSKHWLERWLGAIAITASISPLLGLLGTVSGMIETFKMMTLFGSGDPEVVSGGIAQALITTELGLVVAIPALILNAALSRRAKSYYNDLENFAVLLSQPGGSGNTEPVLDPQVLPVSPDYEGQKGVPA